MCLVKQHVDPGVTFSVRATGVPGFYCRTAPTSLLCLSPVKYVDFHFSWNHLGFRWLKQCYST